MLLARMHRELRPRNYVEIGVFKAQTLLLAAPQTLAISIDPQPQISAVLHANARIHARTSDDFFAPATTCAPDWADWRWTWP